MRRIGLAVVLTFSLLLASLLAEGQQARKVYRIGFLSSQTATTLTHVINAFRQKLRDLGYVEAVTSPSSTGRLRADTSGFLLWRES